jgi:hypothetical protein
MSAKNPNEDVEVAVTEEIDIHTTPQDEHMTPQGEHTTPQIEEDE